MTLGGIVSIVSICVAYCRHAQTRLSYTVFSTPGAGYVTTLFCVSNRGASVKSTAYFAY